MNKKLWLVICIASMIIANTYGQTKDGHDKLDSITKLNLKNGHTQIYDGVVAPKSDSNGPNSYYPPPPPPDTGYYPIGNSQKYIRPSKTPIKFVDNYLRMSIIDVHGKTILPFAFQSIIQKGNYFIGTMGASKFLYDSNFINVPFQNNILLDKTNTRDYFIVRSNTDLLDTLGVGIIDKKGGTILPKEYASVSNIDFYDLEEEYFNNNKENKV